MLLYVIPFILLLVVAVVLKKREDANKEQASSSAKTSKNKKSTKKNVARTARTSQRLQSNVVEDEVIVKQATKPLSVDLKKSIEKLIAEKNYFSAEAKINQALNQDNAQHELYRYLLDIHFVQKDDFAVNQLINHIRSLGLDEIVTQAEDKQKTAQVANPIESIAFESAQPAVPEVNKNNAAFDALIGTADAAPQTKQATQADTIQADALEFTPSETPKHVPQEPIQPLEFNFTPSTQQAASVASDLTFEAPTQVPAEEAKSESAAPLEFSFTPNQATTPVIEKTEIVEIASEFTLDFAEPLVSPNTEPTAKISNDLDFKLTPSEADSQPTFRFDLDQTTEIIEPATPTLNFEAPIQPTTETIGAVDANDPLVKSFPELAQVNETQLNLDLAQQYIDLGAYASARELLSQNVDQYTTDQRELSQNLLNRIAS